MYIIVKGQLSEYFIWLQIMHMFILMCQFGNNYKWGYVNVLNVYITSLLFLIFTFHKEA